MKLKKLVSIILLILILVNSMSGIANAFEVDSAYVENLGDCGRHLQFKTTSGTWSYVITTMVGYRNNGVLHYAYCLNVDKHGVGEEQNYSVNVTEILSDVHVWRAIVNGFPYKSASELGVENPDFETLAENSMKDACAGANPVFFDKELLIKLFKKIA